MKCAADLTEKIRLLFEEMKCPAITILRTPNAGQEVDNGCGLDFELSEYAVIYSGDGKAYYEDESLSKFHNFQRENSIDIMTFAEVGCCNGVKALAEELNLKDGYEIIYQQV